MASSREDGDISEAHEVRSRAPSRKGYHNKLVNLTSNFNKLTKNVQNTIELVNESMADPDSLRGTLYALEATKGNYLRMIDDLETLFQEDKWGESDEVKATVATVGQKYLEATNSAIQRATSRLESLSIREGNQSVRTAMSSRSSKRSQSYQASSTSVRQKAVAEAAATREQTGFDLVIAEKERARKESKADEERERAASQAQHEHEIAVLKAKKKSATAEARLNAIEQLLCEAENEALYGQGDHKSDTTTKDPTHSWVKEQKTFVSERSKESSIRQQEGVPIEVNTSEQQRQKENYRYSRELEHVNEKLAESLARISLPKCHPDVFSGDVTMFHPWRNSFEGMIRDCSISPEQEMNYLNMYTRGEPQKLVNNFRRRQYDDAKKLLKELWSELESRFGNVATITNVLLGRLREAAKFQESERKKLQAFADLCMDVKSQMTYLPGLACLNYPIVIQPMLNNLPPFIRIKWEKRVVDYAMKHQDGYPEFTKFASLVKEQALSKNHANVTTGRITRVERERAEAYGKKRPEFNSYKGNAETDTRMAKEFDDTVKHCGFHDITGHSLLECRTFRSKTLQERTEWMKQAGLCFRCSAKNHVAKECSAEVKCDKCNSTRHQTILHREKKTYNDGEEVASKRSDIEQKVIGGPSCSKVILLDLLNPQKRNNVIRIYAVIDEQSNASMISPELVDQLGISGEKEKYYLSTCSASRETRYGRRVPGLVVRSMKGSEFRLPTLVECENIPRDKREIPLPEQVRQFEHLKDIADEIPSLDPTAKIQLLIGRDAPELMKVRAFRNGPKGAPWAHQLSLGWTVSGQVCIDRQGGPVHVQTRRTAIQNPFLEDNNPNLPNRIHTNQPSIDGKVSLHVFELCTNKFVVKEDHESPHDNVFQTTDRDNEPGLSVDDRRFNMIMEEGIHKNVEGNWEMPLPIRSHDNPLPNNRSQAVSRLGSLLHSLRKKPQKSEHYFEFMRQLLEKGHAVPAKSIEKDRVNCRYLENQNTWYLPHFGVYHPRKPNKIRVVFDSSSEFKGTSLNNELLSGPDMMNSLLGILIRFRRNPVAVACGIEQMFHCFYVNHEHLWFENYDPTNPIIDYQMTVHLFWQLLDPGSIAT